MIDHYPISYLLRHKPDRDAQTEQKIINNTEDAGHRGLRIHHHHHYDAWDELLASLLWKNYPIVKESMTDITVVLVNV